ncbi:MAG: phosphoadenosine phosphosulfate reductase [Thermoplasmatales archaeon B_DKE]|nr:MAG: phosphoadenosine phosphosulfate reductase [Thermoplasmatales archaeon B_DKE]
MLDDRVNESSEILRRAHGEFGNRVVFMTSFSVEDNVITDLIAKEKLQIRHVTLDTGRLPQETYDVMDAVARRYEITPEILFPDATLIEEMVRKNGINQFRKSVDLRELCCRLRKVEPLNHLLSGYEAWISGIRLDQTSTRKYSKVEEPDTLHEGVKKFNPLLNWTSGEVWEYTKLFDIPFNALYARGYKSIGCAPCTRAVLPNENERSGRWWWEDSIRECGIHTSLPLHANLGEDD